MGKSPAATGRTPFETQRARVSSEINRSNDTKRQQHYSCWSWNVPWSTNSLRAEVFLAFLC